MDWFDLLVVQETLKSLLQHHSSKSSILWCSAFFMVQLSHPYMRSVAQSCLILCDPMNCSTPGFPVHQQLYSNSMSFESAKPSNCLILCHPLLLLPSIFPSMRVFSSESVLHIRWPKYWSFSLSISPSNEYSRLIAVRMDWLDLLTVQGTLKNLLQHHGSKKRQFFSSQLSL